jgi:hydrogenase small subunit
VKMGCWGQVVRCNVAKRGWINGVGGCPNVGGICIACTMPGFPDKFMPFMEAAAGNSAATAGGTGYGGVVRTLRGFTLRKQASAPPSTQTGTPAGVLAGVPAGTQPAPVAAQPTGTPP